MRYLPLLFILLLSSSLLNAEYIRAIKIASFHKGCTAKDAIKTLKYLDLEDVRAEYRVEKYGKYYVLKLEPFTDKITLQKALDKIRRLYKDAYASKIKREIIVRVKEPVEIKIVEVEKIVIKTEIKEVIKEVIKVVEVPVEVKVKEDSKLFQILFFIMFVLFIAAAVVVLKLRKKQEDLEEKNRVLAENSLDFDNLDFDESELDLDEDINFDEILGTKESIK